MKTVAAKLTSKLRLAFAFCFALSLPVLAAGEIPTLETSTGALIFPAGDTHLTELYALAGVVVGPGCRLTVDGDVDAGEKLVVAGGELTVGGNVRARLVWVDARDGASDVRVAGDLLCERFTQWGGAVLVAGDVTVHAENVPPGTLLVSVCCEYARFARTALSVQGTLTVRGGGALFRVAPNLDEASLTAFAAERGAANVPRGYEASGTSYPEPLIWLGALRNIETEPRGRAVRPFAVRRRKTEFAL
ncbi:MAG: hypothetical protein LBT36_01275 [Oscillospiraceae bacterium]|jgi:hypothetical protein|nr:hypothetical protein [Oscillospiraceae bacterium]